MNPTRPRCLVLAAIVALAAAGGHGQQPLTPGQRTEMEMLKGQLSDPDRTAKTKREAALLLLTRAYPQAGEAIGEFLQNDANRPAQIAIAEAIADSGQGREEFIKPLLALLTGAEPSVRGPAANALAACKSPRVLDEFTKILGNRKADASTRLAIIAAMQRILDKEAVDALVGLLSDPDEAIRNAACDALAKLTSIPAFGRDPQRWRSWWAQNKDKHRSVWLTDLADSLARANLRLERENASLRRRLASAMNDLHAATPPAGRDALLAQMLKDPLAEVRLAAARLTQQRLFNPQPLPEPLRAQVRSALADPSSEVRCVIPLLLANPPDEQAVKLLAARLEVEKTPEVREAIYQGLGLLRDPQVWDELVRAIVAEDARAAAAAAAALGRVAEKKPPDKASGASAGAALKKRYQDAQGPEAAALREALLTAMGQLKEERLAGLINSALRDPAATVRLAAINALQGLGHSKSGAAVAALTADPDRGVRLAAVTAVGTLGGPEHIETVLPRTDERIEPDAVVRKQAWTVVMGLLGKADTERLRILADQLAGRDDASDRLIQLLKLWVDKIPADKAGQWVPVRLRLGEVLLEAGRPSEAAGELAAVHAAMTQGGSSDAPRVWAKWIDALLAADDISAVTRIAENNHDKQFAAAVDALMTRLAGLEEKKDWDGVVRLAAAASRRLAPRLGDPQRQQLEEALNQAKDQQRLADRQRLAALMPRLLGADDAARAAAEKELTAMNARAVGPLLAEFSKLLAGDSPDPAAEKAILKLLGNLAPRLTGYDPAAPLPKRRATIEQWRKQTGS